MKQRESHSIGKTKDTGYQVGARKTVQIGSVEAWAYLTAGDGLSLWLGDADVDELTEGTRYRLADGTEGEVRVFSDSHLRMSWHPPGWPRPSTIQLRVIPKEDRSVIAFHQEHLPGPEERTKRKLYYRQVLEKLDDTYRG